MTFSEETRQRAMEIQAKRTRAEQGIEQMVKDRCYYSVDHNAFPTDSQTVYADPKLLTDAEDLWGCDASLREAIQEAAYCPRVYELMRHIKYGRNVTDSDYTELGKLMFDDADNYIFKTSEE